MVAALVAALSGLIWGIGDFAGGKAGQRAHALAVTWLSKVASLPLLALYLLLARTPGGGGVPGWGSFGWGAVAGIFGTAGLVVFYRAMAQGAMTVVAPVAAVTSAALPVLVGLASGERPGAVRMIGVVCAVVAIALVSMAAPPSAAVGGSPVAGAEDAHRVARAPALPIVRPALDVPTSAVPGVRLVATAMIAGAFFAAFFVCLRLAGRVGSDSGLWPNAASQLAAVLVSGALLLCRRPPLPRGAALRWTLLAGPFDLTANVLYLVAARHADLSLVAPLAALYPVSTVLLAMLIDGERLRIVQRIGLSVAVAALALVSR